MIDKNNMAVIMGQRFSASQSVLGYKRLIVKQQRSLETIDCNSLG